MENICAECGKKLDGLVFNYGKRWTCSSCCEDKTDVLHCERGCKVVVATLDAGYICERDESVELFRIGEKYTVEFVEVGRSSSTVELKEFPEKKFNNVFFRRISDQVNSTLKNATY